MYKKGYINTLKKIGKWWKRRKIWKSQNMLKVSKYSYVCWTIWKMVIKSKHDKKWSKKRKRMKKSKNVYSGEIRWCLKSNPQTWKKERGKSDMKWLRSCNCVTSLSEKKNFEFKNQKIKGRKILKFNWWQIYHVRQPWMLINAAKVENCWNIIKKKSYWKNFVKT